MRFTTPCYVLVPQDKERDNLIKWLKEIGYKPNKYLWGSYVVVEDDKAYCPLEIHNYNRINCGFNIELFKAIAALSDETDRDQFFVVENNNKKEMILANSDAAFDYIFSHNNHKATIDEIIDYLN